MPNYLLVVSGEDGVRTSAFTSNTIDNLLRDPYEYAGVTKFLDSNDISALDDIESLEEGEAFLLEFTIVKPKPVTKQWRL